VHLLVCYLNKLAVPYSRIKSLLYTRKSAGGDNLSVTMTTTPRYRQNCPLHIILTHHVVESNFHAFLTPALDRQVWPALCSGPRIKRPILITGIRLGGPHSLSERFGEQNTPARRQYYSMLLTMYKYNIQHNTVRK
jgi:hypothetical protein